MDGGTVPVRLLLAICRKASFGPKPSVLGSEPYRLLPASILAGIALLPDDHLLRTSQVVCDNFAT